MEGRIKILFIRTEGAPRGGVRGESRERGEVWSTKTQLIEDRKDKILTNFDNLQDLIKDYLFWINNTIVIHM